MPHEFKVGDQVITRFMGVGADITGMITALDGKVFRRPIIVTTDEGMVVNRKSSECTLVESANERTKTK